MAAGASVLVQPAGAQRASPGTREAAAPGQEGGAGWHLAEMLGCWETGACSRTRQSQAVQVGAEPQRAGPQKASRGVSAP